MKWKKLWINIFLGSLLLIGCTKESEDFLPISELNITVFNDQKQVVNGVNIAIYEHASEFENAVITRDFSKAYKTSTSASNGKAVFELQPDRTYYILATYFDAERQIYLSNIGISSLIKPLPKRTSIYMDMSIKPENGNVLFYSTAENKIPIDIKFSNKATQKAQKYTLNQIYTSNLSPTITSNQVLKTNIDLGDYAYYATSKDGCIWVGEFKVESDNTILIDFSKCQSGTVSFFTAGNDSLFPLSIKLNQGEISGTLNATRISMTCEDEKTNSFTSTLKEGFFTYIVKSSNGKCIWTGDFTMKDGDCLIIPIEVCK